MRIGRILPSIKSCSFPLDSTVLFQTHPEEGGIIALQKKMMPNGLEHSQRNDGEGMITALDRLTERLIAFRDARDWKQFHSLKNLMASLGIEAAELQQLVQWDSEDGAEKKFDSPEEKEKLADELADIFVYILLICERQKIDLLEATNAKIKKNEAKYPVEKAKGNSKKYTEL